MNLFFIIEKKGKKPENDSLNFILILILICIKHVSI